jgi:hypothetical protein
MLGIVMSARLDRSGAVELAAQSGFAEGFTSDGTYLYWTQLSGAGYQFYRTPL